MAAQLRCRSASARIRLTQPIKGLVAAALSLGLTVFTGCTQFRPEPVPGAEIGFIDVGSGLRLRRMIVSSPEPKGVVLFLHGFPETLYVWKDIASRLGPDFEVHAFDWPGYGLSSRPPVARFAYAPKDYANVLKEYIARSRIDTSKLVIYATDIGALPALLLALDDAHVAKAIVVGDFAPFDRPQHMFPSLQSLKSKPSSEATHAYMNRTREEILENAYRRGLSKDEQFEIPQDVKDDMATGWSQDDLTAADAFYHYYSHFTRDQDYLESNLNRLRTPIRVVWGEKDIYIRADMGVEFARRINAPLRVLPGIGHYPHLQSPGHAVEEVRALFDR